MRGTLCPALKALFEHGLKKPSLLGGACHPWLFIEEVITIGPCAFSVSELQGHVLTSVLPWVPAGSGRSIVGQWHALTHPCPHTVLSTTGSGPRSRERL